MPAPDPRDPFQYVVYDWERTHVEPNVATEVLDSQGIAALLLSASAWLGMRPPSVKVVRGHPSPCHADPSTWSVVIADWGRNATTALHEAAHLGTVDAVRRGEPAHGPAFVGTAMALYAQFMGVPMDLMETSATRRRIPFAVPSRLRTSALPRPGKEDFFEGDW